MASVPGLFSLQEFTDAGAIAASYRLYTYVQGTTTFKAAFTDIAGTVTHTYTNDGIGGQYIALNARGELPAPMYLASGAYDIGLKRPDGSTVWTQRADGIGTDAANLSADLANTILNTKGAGLVGFNASLVYPATSIGRVIKSRRVSPQDAPFNAVGDGVADDTAALVACALAALNIDLGGSDKSYKINGAVALRSGHNIISSGATVTQTAIRTEIFNIEGRSDVTISGVKFVGVGTDFNDSDSSRAVAIFGSGSESRIKVFNNVFTGFSYTSLRVVAATDVEFFYNTVVGPGSPTLTAITSGRCYGVLADAGCARVAIVSNSISKCAQGVRVEQSSKVRVIGNAVFDIVGQHGLYLGAGLTDITVSGNIINNVSLIGIKSQTQNPSLGNQRIAITGNTLTACGDQGILISNGAGGTAQAAKNVGVTITGNTLVGSGGSGINVQNAVGAVVSGNVIDGALLSGINISASDNPMINGNQIMNSVMSAIRDQTVCTNVSITNNKVINCASAASAGDRYGIYLQDGTNCVVTGNSLTDANAKMEYGVFIASGTQNTMSVAGNIVTSATLAGARFKNGTESMLLYKNNLFNGTVAATSNDPLSPTVASAATMTLPQAQDVVFVSGAVNITSINTNGHGGRIVVLVFVVGGQTVTDGTNLNLAGNFVTTPNDTLTLACDGVSWNEVARSAN